MDCGCDYVDGRWELNDACRNRADEDAPAPTNALLYALNVKYARSRVLRKYQTALVGWDLRELDPDNAAEMAALFLDLRCHELWEKTHLRAHVRSQRSSADSSRIWVCTVRCGITNPTAHPKTLAPVTLVIVCGCPLRVSVWQDGNLVALVGAGRFTPCRSVSPMTR